MNRIAYDQDKGNLYLIVDGGRKCCVVWLDNLKGFIERALRHYVVELQSVKFILTWYIVIKIVIAWDIFHVHTNLSCDIVSAQSLNAEEADSEVL